jgi:hypothetical protein
MEVPAKYERTIRSSLSESRKGPQPTTHDQREALETSLVVAERLNVSTLRKRGITYSCN